jgi:predicted RNA binding protein YcfA (HicA-like mRNA interferase family)
LIHAADPARKVTVPIHNTDLKRGTLRAIIAQSGLSVAEFLALL